VKEAGMLNINSFSAGHNSGVLNSAIQSGIMELTLTNSDTAGCDFRTIQHIIKFLQEVTPD